VPLVPSQQRRSVFGLEEDAAYASDSFHRTSKLAKLGSRL
jgi:hypothetical protein